MVVKIRFYPSEQSFSRAARFKQAILAWQIAFQGTSRNFVADGRFSRFPHAGGMNDLHQHYRELLGMNASWSVDAVDLDLTGTQVVVPISFAGAGTELPRVRGDVSRCRHGLGTHLAHLDTRQFTTQIRAAVPRSRCEKRGVKTIRVS